MTFHCRIQFNYIILFPSCSFRYVRSISFPISFAARNRMQYDGQWFRDRRHGNGTLTIEAAGKAMGAQGTPRDPSRATAQAPTTPVLGIPRIDILES